MSSEIDSPPEKPLPWNWRSLENFIAANLAVFGVPSVIGMLIYDYSNGALTWNRFYLWLLVFPLGWVAWSVFFWYSFRPLFNAMTKK